ncbi:conserved hypothetical protein [Hyphomicrobiales bacterium]|jgi:hypothetical protein|uniref:hypothetical protein n=1 Tax=unclassified Chelatococcus TaxID=2638111 RepID=UPI001BCF2D2B|nr:MULTISPECIES: hypothetical protein [unclassified Chelatococcus]CAH1649204.1 conserved hypothetical protein [Hyphomicrobiales bacterium]MBS7739576.1 hypothetical protein [Chelatococcus sp. HY11]MBX3537615.1 hypothetical protein [Chelatococcus sp.]MBX3543945.1 hypothetical protein [Chelatococcus sp.]MCO5075887.1 hypothetical protein [Chelatococcus sp.]
MSTTRRATITIEVDADLLDELRASVGGDREVGDLLEKAVEELASSFARAPKMASRESVLEAYEQSVQQYGTLYERLAK